MPRTEKNLEITLEKLKAAKERVSALEQKLAAERQESLASLHEAVGYDSRAALIDALEQLGGVRRALPSGSVTANKPRGKRTRITPEMRAAIIKELKAGKKGVAVAAQFGISNPSLHNIKKAAGMVKGRKK